VPPRIHRRTILLRPRCAPRKGRSDVGAVINLTGIYDLMREPQPKGTFRPLRTAKEKFIAAA
jgi:hypothetical protein